MPKWIVIALCFSFVQAIPTNTFQREYSTITRPQRQNSKFSRDFQVNNLTERPFSSYEYLSKVRTNISKYEDYEENELTPKIVNGREAEPGELPWMVALYYNNMFRCSAFLISPRLLMTAAHCVEFENGIEPPSAFYGIAGNVDRLGTQTRLEFTEVIPNRGFRQGTNEFDIAVMRIAEPLEFNDYMKALCLPRGGRDFEFDYSEAMGWGLTATFGDEPSDVLRAVELTVEPRPLCQVFFAFMMITITDRHICATSTTRKGACFGDSGGPLVYDDPMSGNPVAIGVASFITPLGCARPLAPSVYSATAVYADWVVQAVGQDASEVCFV